MLSLLIIAALFAMVFVAMIIGSATRDNSWWKTALTCYVLVLVLFYPVIIIILSYFKRYHNMIKSLSYLKKTRQEDLINKIGGNVVLDPERRVYVNGEVLFCKSPAFIAPTKDITEIYPFDSALNPKLIFLSFIPAVGPLFILAMFLFAHGTPKKARSSSDGFGFMLKDGTYLKMHIMQDRQFSTSQTIKKNADLFSESIDVSLI